MTCSSGGSRPRSASRLAYWRSRRSTRGRRGGRATGRRSLACAAASPVAAIFLALGACADWIVYCSTNGARARARRSGAGLDESVRGVAARGGYGPFATASLLAASGASLCVLCSRPAIRLLARRSRSICSCCSVATSCPRRSAAMPSASAFCSRRRCWSAASRSPTCRRGRRRSSRSCKANSDAHARPPIAPSSLAKASPRRCLQSCVALMIGWESTGPLSQSVGALLSPSSHASLHAPGSLVTSASAGARPPDSCRGAVHELALDADVLGAHFLLARGWSVRSTRATTGLFYGPSLTASAYRSLAARQRRELRRAVRCAA